MMVKYGTPVTSAMMNEPAPMIGGMICPPTPEMASTAAASRGLYPVCFIMGMVNEPVAYTLATVEPDTVPYKAEEMTATFAGPPRAPPASHVEKSIRYAPAPVIVMTPAKMMYTYRISADMPVKKPNMPSSLGM